MFKLTVVLCTMFLFSAPAALWASRTEGNEGRTSIAILEFQTAPDVPTGAANAMSAKMREYMVRITGYTLIDKAHMDQVLQEQKLALKFCAQNDKNCLIQVGHQLAVEEIITGSIDLVDGAFVITVEHTDTETARLLHSQTRTCRCSQETLIDAGGEILAKMFAGRVPVDHTARNVARYGGVSIAVIGAALVWIGQNQAASARSTYEKRNQSANFYDTQISRVKRFNNIQTGGWFALGVGAVAFGVSWSLP